MTLAPETALSTPKPPEPESPLRPGEVVLVGNPNVGKSVLFGLLTGRYVTVSNYPGTTVTVSRGKLTGSDDAPNVVDTPGVNSLVPTSEDERVTRDILFERPPRAVIQVADAKNLRRALLITSQLSEAGIPFVLDLNMNDEARDLGVTIDQDALEKAIGVRVVNTVAVRRKGFDDLRDALDDQKAGTLAVTFPPPVEEAIAEILPHLPKTHVSRRAMAVTLLAGDREFYRTLQATVGAAACARIDETTRRAERWTREPLATVITRSRLYAVDRILKTVERRPQRKPGSFLDTVGSLAMHPLWGIPILLAVLWAMYQFVGVLGAGILVDILETQVFGNWLAPGAIHAADFLFRFPHEHIIEKGVLLPEYALGTGGLTAWQHVAAFLHDALVGPYGQITMALSYAIALILPIVATFFIAFSILEDSGYLPRLAVMVNRLFRTLGLNGKAVLPMVLGLGCDTMATLTTRILKTKKERILVTLLLALGVPCSAQLGVILGMIRSLSIAATLVWAGTIVVTMFVVGWLAARLVPGERADFILELPPIRRPQLGNIVVKTLARIEWYLREAVPLFLLGTLVLFLLDRFALLGMIQTAAAPVIEGILGLPGEASEAFLVGFLRRDYGAAGLYQLSREGMLDSVQLIVAMVTITLFVPCIANFLIMIKERGAKIALAMVAFIVPAAFLVGGLLNFGLRALKVTF